jgi:beta-glucosidase-like glycosyl hydrolase
VKWDLGLFNDPYIPENIDPFDLVDQHVPLTLEAAHKSIVLLENKNAFLPLDASNAGLRKIALIGPFSDILNYGGEL